jgi:hypothetical protein
MNHSVVFSSNQLLFVDATKNMLSNTFEKVPFCASASASVWSHRQSHYGSVSELEKIDKKICGGFRPLSS